MAVAISGFYAVLDRDDPGLAESLLSGARVLQIRFKPASAREILGVARWARELTRRHGAQLIVNDRIDLALLVGADGVHLGQDDLPIADARRIAERAGAHMVIGISTHDDDQVQEAVTAGADYLGFGPVFATRTKQNPDPVQGIRGLERAVALAGQTPVVAIGGIDLENVVEVAATGVAAACAISAINDAGDPRRAAGVFASAWAKARSC